MKDETLIALASGERHIHNSGLQGPAGVRSPESGSQTANRPEYETHGVMR